MHTALLIALALGSSWDDGEGRYSLELPAGWRFSQAESHLDGPVFRAKKRRRGAASVTVSVSSVPDAIGIGGIHRERLSAIEGLSGAKLLEDRPDVLGGYRGRRLVYTVVPDGEPKVTVHELITQLYNRGYVLRFEAESRHFDAFSDDLEAWRRGFEPRRGRKTVAGAEPPPLVGRWIPLKRSGPVLVLSADGSLQMDDAHGRYAVSRDTIVTLLKDGDSRSYQWNVDGRMLVLKSDRGQLRYRRER